MFNVKIEYSDSDGNLIHAEYKYIEWDNVQHVILLGIVGDEKVLEQLPNARFKSASVVPSNM